MATIDLPSLLHGIGEDIQDSVREVAKSLALPEELREKARVWAAAAAGQLVIAAKAKLAGDGGAYDAAVRELHLYRKAVEAVATGELMMGLAAAEVEARKRLSDAFSLGLSIGVKVLAAALV